MTTVKILNCLLAKLRRDLDSTTDIKVLNILNWPLVEKNMP